MFAVKNVLSPNIPHEYVYAVFAACAYGCILTVLILALVFGRRARRNVKKEKVTSLPQGLSPLDVQRIFIGKTFPRRLTRALLAWWGQCGYVKIVQVSKNRVRVVKLKDMPRHDDGAVFFDRGTYVREKYLFDIFQRRILRGETVSLLKPLFSKQEVKQVNEAFAVREDEGVYSAKHYTLKILTLILSCLPLVLLVVWDCIYFATALSLIFLGTAAIGYFVLMFAQEMPILIKLIWCGLWLSVSFGALWATTEGVYDPAGMYYAALAMLFVGSFVLLRFVDYRERINLDDYSMLVNYRKYLLFTPKHELIKTNYYPALPYIYAFKIKPLVRRKYGDKGLPQWYDCKDCERGRLI